MHFIESTRRIGLIFTASLAMITACADSVDHTTEATQQLTGPSITTDSTSYAVGDSVTATYAGLPGNMYDWVSVAVAGSSVTSFVAWYYVDGQSGGSQIFTGLAAGTYEARAYSDDSFTLLATSPSFTVNGNTSPSVTTDASSYTVGQTVTANFTNLPGNQFDWVAVAVAGSAVTSYVAWYYVNGAAMGSETFSGLAAGSYEARAYLNDSFTLLATSPTFTVTSGTTSNATVSTSASTYLPGDTVVVNFMNLPGNTYDWVSVAVAGSAVTSYVAWFYTNGQINGSEMFAGLPSGNYEARAYSNDSFTLLATSTFKVAAGPPAVTTDASSYASGATVNVEYSNMPGNTYDWVSVAVAGSSVTSFVAWFYINGQVNGSQAFAGLADGSYEARTYSNDSFTLVASSTFTVGP